MKIFSSFDTNIKNERKKHYIEIYGKDNVVILEKSRLFLLIYITIPLITLFLISVSLLYFIYIVTQNNIKMTISISIPVIIILLSRMFNNIIKNLIEVIFRFLK